MKNLILPFGIVLFIIAISAGAILSSTSSDDQKKSAPMMSSTQDWPHNYPKISSDGMSVMVEGRTILTVPNAKMSNQKVKYLGIAETDGKSTIRIEADGKSVTHSARDIESPLWCESRQTLYFIQTGRDSSQIWQWSKETGFRSISKSYDQLSDLTISPDAKVIAAHTDSDDQKYAATTYVVRSLIDDREKLVTYNDSSENMVPLTMREGLVDGHNKLGNQTYRWRYDSENVTPISRDANIVSVTCIDGSLYGVHKRNKDFEVVHLNQKMDGWTDSFSIPKDIKRQAMLDDSD